MARKRTAPTPSEHEEQTALMRWWSVAAMLYGVHEASLFAIPNGGLRNVIVATRLKAEGVRAGIPDLFLAVPRGGLHGLFIELKRARGGRTSDVQENAMGLLRAQGFRCIVCRGCAEAKAEIDAYLTSG